MDRAASLAWRSSLTIPLLIFGTISVVCVIWMSAVLWLRPGTLAAFDPTAAHLAWQQRIREDISRLNPQSSSQEIDVVLQDLFSLRVAAQDREAHLALVIALTALGHRSPDAFVTVQSAYLRTQL